MSRVIHRWLIKRIVTVVAVAIALPKEMIIPRMRKAIPFTGHSEARYAGNSKRPTN
jgi:hypothetical protein